MLCMFVCDREKKTETEKESNRETKTSERERVKQRKREKYFYSVWTYSLVGAHVLICVYACTAIIFDSGTLTEGETHWLGWVDWPVSFRSLSHSLVPNVKCSIHHCVDIFICLRDANSCLYTCTDVAWLTCIPHPELISNWMVIKVWTCL